MTIESNENEEIIKRAAELGLTTEIKVRDFRIREKFKQLRAAGGKYEDSIFQLSERFHLSDKSIERIIKGIKIAEVKKESPRS